MSPVCSVHIHRVGGWGVFRAVFHMGADRFALRRMRGLRFWKLLGTGSGDTFGVRDADLFHWALFCVWDSEAERDRFESSDLARSWAQFSRATWSATLAPLAWKGSWSGVDPFAGFDPIESATSADEPVIAAVTRARVRPRQWRSFWCAVPAVAASMRETPGLIYRVGIGEAPLGLQGTFSLWESNESINTFAYKTRAHTDVIRETHRSGWYAEELFARFVVLSSKGTLNGLDRS